MRERELRGYLCVLMAAFFWGLLGIMANFAGSYGLGAYETSFMRLFFGAVILGGGMLVLKPGTFRVDRRVLLFCMVIGVISQGLFNIFYFTSIIELGITAGVIMLYTSPAFTLIFSRIFLGAPLTRIKIFAIGVTFTGSILTVSGGDFHMNYSTLGIAAGFLAGATYGILPVFNNMVSSKVEAPTIMYYSFLAGLLVVTPFTDLGRIYTSLTLDYRVILVGAALGFFPTVASHFAFLEASKRLETFEISILANFEVVVAATTAYLIYSEPLGGARVAGIILVISGALLPEVYKKISKDQKKLEQNNKKLYDKQKFKSLNLILGGRE